MLTKQGYLLAVADVIANYPALQPLYQVGDPRLVQQLEAQATMFALLSAQIETAQGEPFEKARDATVLADASLKGIVRKATPVQVGLLIANNSESPFTINSGLGLTDSNGRLYSALANTTIAASGTATIQAVQGYHTVITHTVTGSKPFYQVQIPEADDGSYLSSIAVQDADDAYQFAYKYTNIGSGDKIFHIEVDEFQRVYVRFGWDGVVGFQPTDGTAITITVGYCLGDIQPDTGSPFALQYVSTPQHALIDLTLATVTVQGEDPATITLLRDLAKYPSVYDDSAVYLSEFDFVIRRNITGLAFLSVWNEATEELLRGYSVNNINTLFIACKSATGDELVITDSNPFSVEPLIILALTGFQTQIKSIVASADSSYRVKFYTPVKATIGMSVNATIPTNYDGETVKNQIKAELIAKYGVDTNAAKHGALNPNYQETYAYLRAQVLALQDANSDFTLYISPPPNPVRPEHWRYADTNSVSVTVTPAVKPSYTWGT